MQKVKWTGEVGFKGLQVVLVRIIFGSYAVADASSVLFENARFCVPVLISHELHELTRL